MEIDISSCPIITVLVNDKLGNWNTKMAFSATNWKFLRAFIKCAYENEIFVLNKKSRDYSQRKVKILLLRGQIKANLLLINFR